MNIIKRNGNKVPFDLNKLKKCVADLSTDLCVKNCDELVIQKTQDGLFDGVTTTQITDLLSITATHSTISHPDYGILGGRLAVLNLHKSTTDNLKTYADTLYAYVNPKNNKPGPLLTEATYDVFIKYADQLNQVIDYNRDFNFTSFGINTLLKSYLIKIDKRVYERPQQLYMRVAIGIHEDDIASVIQTYEYLSTGMYTHATPTMFHSGTPHGQLASCFLVGCEDNLESIFDTISKFARISKSAGGVGMYISDIRAQGSYIAGTNGESNGIVPFMETLNKVARYVDQGGNKRPGAIALYIEPWHADVYSFIKSVLPKYNSGSSLNMNLFLGLMIPDLFMQRVKNDDVWSLMCPDECPGLTDCYGDEFEKLYTRYESEKKYIKQVKAQHLFELIRECQLEKGLPYILYKDACNKKSNQKNLGTIKCSNLCTEILQQSTPNEEAVCNLASIALPKCVKSDKTYDFKKLHAITKVVTKNLNKVIDVTTYPLNGAKCSNIKHRPIGIGVQGLADTFAMMRLPFESKEAQSLNIQIFETIYHGALEASMELSIEFGPYSSYDNSPVSKGELQYDMWGITPTDLWDWSELKRNIAKHGIRNSLVTALMPTASTAQILGNVEAFYPFDRNIYTRSVNSGQFQCANKYLVEDLIKLNLWNERMKNKLILAEGSIQNIDEIPNDIKLLYKTIPEMSNKILIKMVADRGAYVDQSQSFSPFIDNPKKLTRVLYEGWEKGLKTGSYYIKTSSGTLAAKVSSSQSSLSSEMVCVKNGDCISCSS